VVVVEVVFDDGTLVDTPTRCNNTKNNREERVRISRAIRTGVAGNGGGWRLDVVVVGIAVVVVGRQRRRFIEEEDMIGIGDDGDEDDNESDVRPSILGGGGGDIAAGYGIGSIGIGVGNVWSKLFGGSEEEEAVDADDGQSSLSPPPQPSPPSLSTFREVLVGLSRLMMIVGVPLLRFVVVVVAVKVMLHQPSIGRCTDEQINVDVADDSYLSNKNA
jgi:hypothetical protein